MMKGLFYGGTLFATFLLTVLISRFLIPYLKSKKMGQKILEIGPRWHKNKEGTPTMGGLSFVFASFLVLLVVVPLGYALDFLSDIKGLLLVYGYALLNCLIGVIDDRTKFKKGKNEQFTDIKAENEPVNNMQLVRVEKWYNKCVWALCPVSSVCSQ